MENEQKLARHYEEAQHYFYNELDLLFKRFNFFLVATAFLAVAFVAVVTSGGKGLIQLAHAIAALASFLSIAFFVINYLNVKIVKIRSDYLRDEVPKLDAKLSLFALHRRIGDYLDERIKKEINATQLLHDFLGDLWRLREPLELSKEKPAVHTWVIPLVFYAFWFASWRIVSSWRAPLVFLGALLLVVALYVLPRLRREKRTHSPSKKDA